MPTTILRAALLFLLAMAHTGLAQTLPPFYERRADHDPAGTGIFFMGREVAHVCQGGEWLERPERELEENVELMVQSLNLRPGEIIADVGAGTGYISRKLAKGVGENGVVYAVEIQQEMLDTLTNKAAQAGITNIKPILGTLTDPKLPEAGVDTILMVDVYHEFDRPYEMVKAMCKTLKPGGRIVFIEYRAEDPKVPIKPVHKMSEAQVKKEMTVHALTWTETIRTLPWQHMIIFRKGLPPSRKPITTAGQTLASLEEVLESKRDLWGEAAIQQSTGPTYEFFRDVLPPLRYVNTTFRHYPIVLSAPGATNKARFISNGSGINTDPELRHVWKQVGTPVTFYVGATNETFGADVRRLNGPTYADGYLPIVRLSYESDGATYSQESFAAVESDLAKYGVVFVQFKLQSGATGTVSARIDSTNTLTFTHDEVRDDKRGSLVLHEGDWKWNAATKTLTATLKADATPTLAIATQPMPVKPFKSAVTAWKTQRGLCAQEWASLLSRGTRIDVPEEVVNNAWRSLIVGNYLLLKGDAPNYSAGNQYERLYEAESGDTTRSVMLFGQTNDARRMTVPCLDYARKGLYFHQAAFKLQLLAHYYWITRDAEFVRQMRPRWSKEVQRIIEGREKESGLLPKEQYAGDIFQDVYSLNSNANCSKGLRDIAAVLKDMGEKAEAERILKHGDELRRATVAAVEKSIFKETQPPFIPIALFGVEKPYDRITDTKLGSYWNEMAPYVLCSDVFGLGSERETQLLEYQYQHGGLIMGMVRFHQHSGLFANEDGVDDLYGLRHTEKLLQRDEVDRALVSFYGKLAHGMTRDTFIGAEGTSFRALDEFGRPMYLPPNSTANAFFLSTLRGLLVQDIDANDDCSPDTLRLCFATPRQWLENGKTINVQRAPTAFGEVSFKVRSRLKDGEVIAEITPPTRQRPEKTLFRVRLPAGWEVVSAKSDGKTFKTDPKGTIDISSLRNPSTVTIRVKPSR